MILDTFRRVALDPGLNLLPQRMDTTDARVMIVTICLHESLLRHRWQLGRDLVPRGPARGYPQFELAGVRGVFRHRATRKLIRIICEELDIDPTPQAAHEAMRWCDTLAVCLARLLLWTLPQPLPHDDVAEAERQYLAAWRPGKHDPERFRNAYQRAQEWVTW